jgi:hypothetical protein
VRASRASVACALVILCGDAGGAAERRGESIESLVATIEVVDTRYCESDAYDGVQLGLRLALRATVNEVAVVPEALTVAGFIVEYVDDYQQKHFYQETFNLPGYVDAGRRFTSSDVVRIGKGKSEGFHIMAFLPVRKRSSDSGYLPRRGLVTVKWSILLFRFGAGDLERVARLVSAVPIATGVVEALPVSVAIAAPRSGKSCSEGQ